jgi:hypothetical protein
LRILNLSVLVGSFLFSSLAYSQAAYKFFSFEYPSSGTGLKAIGKAINGKGAIVGSVSDPSDPGSPVQGFYRSPQGVFTLINFPVTLLGEPSGTPVYTSINGIAYSGEMIGTVTDSISGASHAFLISATGGVFTLIDPPGPPVTHGLGIGIKNAGESFGTSDSRLSTDYYIRSPVNTYQFVACPSIPSSTTHPLVFNAINDHGNSVGAYWDATTSLPHVFTRTAGGHCALFPDAPGAIATAANSLNDSGLVAGGYVDSTQVMHGFVWTPSTGFQTVDDGVSGTTLFAINSVGDVLGETDSGTTFYGAPQTTVALGVPSTVSFGSVSVGASSKPVSIYVHNLNSQTIVLGLPNVPAPAGPTNGTFTIVSNGCPAVLGANQSCSISVTIHASAAGSISGVLQLDSTAANAPHQVQLSGTGK